MYNNQTKNSFHDDFLDFKLHFDNGFIDRRLIKMFYKKEKLIISTLGPENTSSDVASRYLMKLLSIENTSASLLRDNYEDSMEDLLSGNADIVVVANAYYKIDAFYMCPELKLLSSFILNTPQYGIACKNFKRFSDNDGDIDIITHHAPVSLIPWFINDSSIKYSIHLISSTAMAAENVVNGNYNFCVTNEEAANKYNLCFITRTRPIEMLWSVFGPK